MLGSLVGTVICRSAVAAGCPGRIRPHERGPGDAHINVDDDAGSAEFAVVMIGVFFLLSLALVVGVNFAAAQAAASAAQRAVQVAQTQEGPRVRPAKSPTESPPPAA